MKDDVIGTCDYCQEDIPTFSKWVENEDGVLACGDCLEQFTVDEWLEFTHHKWGTSDIPHNEFLREAMGE